MLENPYFCAMDMLDSILAAGFVGGLIYVIFNRIRERKEEDFEQRDN